MSSGKEWPANLFLPTGNLNVDALESIELCPAQSPSHATQADFLTLPPEILVSLVRNKCEAGLLLEIGHCAFKLDVLLGKDREKAYHEQVRFSCPILLYER